ncbi:AbrB/MazE/SpoVT family DNA-binding domain-containing protein [Cellulomonas fengjieae]|uniref:AbrB/MazE/SpoVT family DNA-binding domain-containing protein n=1 Tax=Cellulomonas fengjieae TaxID=2819978 RepID=A0ABS3SE69_9CELL|nr:AbrB/MazE/SpoVT family DNA-binding domain-containing protein [Cellulomonas fengjieae]MBO3084046.1 AbrB/MazE/SpoVT family DNA-binding domain-containing protein [Cellulomonas fengjieae]QVI64696.1 AbrB/MazE/SpoVT family DNA-binding domain-containing protein [Cellulomonas fengjieae]
MPLFRRRLPAAVRARLDLRPGDTVLVSTELSDGRWAVASRRALHLVPPDGPAARHPWSDVDHGSLDPETRTMTLRWVWGDSERLTFSEAPGSFAFSQTFRERVQQSVVHAAAVSLPGGKRARVVLRRDEDGKLFTQVLGDAAIDLTDAAVAAAVDAAEDEVRDAVGLPR